MTIHDNTCMWSTGTQPQEHSKLRLRPWPKGGGSVPGRSILRKSVRSCSGTSSCHEPTVKFRHLVSKGLRALRGIFLSLKFSI